jgi:hypothetical protein
MQKQLNTEEVVKSHPFSIVPKDPDKDLIPLIQKIGRGVVFTVYDDFQQPREIA